MLASALIVFREVLEAALIIGIVLAATAGLPGRHRTVTTGVGVGLAGAGVVAFFAGSIAAAAEGMGQELFNAAILLVAAGLLAWHNIWMARHGRELAARVNAVGSAVRDGARPIHALGAVVALAILREGAEVVLFAYGIAAGGAGLVSLATGAALGLVAGVGVGAALYLGLLRIPARHLFAVTGALLVLLTAGLAAGAVRYLVQAGWLPAIKAQLWDTSAWLSQHSLPGQALHTLIGYSERPAAIEVAVYAATVIALGVFTIAAQKPALRRFAIAVSTAAGLALATLVTASPAHASHKVYYPTVEAGETEIELRGHVDLDSEADKDNGQKFKFGVGHGFTQNWFSEVYAEIEREPGDSRYGVESWEWENLFQLTEQGRYFADFGLQVEYSKARETEAPDKWEITPIAQKQFGPRLLTVNLTFERETGAGSEHEWELAYAWQLLWLGSPGLNFGVEGYGEVGEVGDWKPSPEQEHQAGPLITGKLGAAGAHSWKYRLALLAGFTSGTPDATVTGMLEYEL